ncbi:MAG: glycoside hydrolase family 88 protein [Edaphocola sp.]
MRLANKYFMDKWTDVGKDIFVPSRNKSWPSHIWTRAVYYEGLMALYAVDKQPTYIDYGINWGIAHNWNFRDGIQTRNADNQCAGQTYFDLYLIKKDTQMIGKAKASIDLMLASDKKDDWNWIDAIQMAMPLFARLGNYYKDSRYFDKMWQMYSYAKYECGGKGLYSREDHLWWRDADFVPPYKEPNGKDCYWSRGNGWVVAALVRVLEQLPATDPHYAEYLQDYKDMMAALKKVQRTDGFWNVSLEDPTHFGGKETTGTSLFVYGMAWGVNHGFLKKKGYRPSIAKAWAAMLKESVHPDGFLGYVQSTGKEPKDGQPVAYDRKPDFEDYGLGCFLLAGSEVYKLR